MKKILKIFLIIILVILVMAGGLLTFITIFEYNPEEIEDIQINGKDTNLIVQTDRNYSLISWNVGYAGIDEKRDSALDGGGTAPTPTYDDVISNLNGIKKTLDNTNADFFLLQEVDKNSSRTYSIDERDILSYGNDAFALNYSAPFVPYPIPDMIMKVNAGIFTTTMYDMDSAQRYSLPNPFSWPIRSVNLKRCMMVTYLPIEDSDKKLVLINLHLEAYTSGEAKTAQTKKLLELISDEFAKGNYVIAGGDWNQGFPKSLEKYPNNHEDLWEIQEIENDMLGDGINLYTDLSYPSCRLLNQAYNPKDKENTQYYVIDGFVCSANVQVNTVKTLHEDFKYSDHNPIELNFTLKPEN